MMMNWSSSQELVSKIKTLVWTMLFWTSNKKASTLLEQNPDDQENEQVVGLRTLLMSSPSDHEPTIVQSNVIIPYWSTYSSSSLKMDDLIGTESGVYLSSSNYEQETKEIEYCNRSWCKYGSNKDDDDDDGGRRKKEYPPAISVLAQTGNMRGRMPWNLRREYVDGKLILKEEKVEHHEYFEAYRDNGRLILKLVPLDTKCCHTAVTEDEDEEEDSKCCHTVSEDEEEEDEDVKKKQSDDDEDEEEEETILKMEMDNKRSSMVVFASLPKLISVMKYNGADQSGSGRRWTTYGHGRNNMKVGGDQWMSNSVSFSFPVGIRPVTAVM